MKFAYSPVARLLIATLLLTSAISARTETAAQGQSQSQSQSQTQTQQQNESAPAPQAQSQTQSQSQSQSQSQPQPQAEPQPQPQPQTQTQSQPQLQPQTQTQTQSQSQSQSQSQIEQTPAAAGAAAAPTAGKKSCEAQVIRGADGKTLLDVSACAQDLQNLQTVSPVTFTDDDLAIETSEKNPAPALRTQKMTVSRPARRDVRLSLGVYTSSGDRVSFPHARRSDPTGTVTRDVSYNTNTAPGLTVEAALLEPQSWGFQMGMSFDGRRRIESVEVTSANSTQTTGMFGEPEMSLAHFYANALYRWRVIYIPFGLNYSFVSLRNPPPALVGLQGGLGAQLGVGFALSEHVALELISRGTTLRAAQTTSSGVTNDLGTGTMLAGHLALKVTF